MKKNLCLYSVILLLIGSNYSTTISSSASTKTSINNNSKIKLDYLNQLPKNDYILVPGDSFVVKVARELLELEIFVTVDGEGIIYLPRLKRIYVNGFVLLS